jgi:hypothetical protein
VGDLFGAALLPGLILTGTYAVYVVGLSLVKKEVAPALAEEARSHGLDLLRRVVVSLVPPLFLIVVVLGSIFAGVATPTEAGALGAVGAMLLAALNRQLSIKTLQAAMEETSRLTIMVIFLLIGSTAFALVFRGLDGDIWIADALTAVPGGALGFLLVVNVVVFILGFFIDFFEIAFIIVPLIVVPAQILQIDLTVLGIVLAMNLQTSFLTPPFGFSLFYLRGVTPDRIPTTAIYRGVIPFIAIQLVVLAAIVYFALLVGCGGEGAEEGASLPILVRHQEGPFADPGAQPLAWADYDGDGDLDLFVGFRGRANRLYRNQRGTFVDVAAEAGLADEAETRAAAWGDYDADGDLDLYVGFRLDPEAPNRLYRNEGGTFVDVAPDLGVAHSGNTRQPSFVDYDGDGDLDLFVAFREQTNRLYRNEGGRFTDVTQEAGVGDPRRTVGAAWLDMDGDADLDLFLANQNGDEDAFYRNLGDGTFEDVAAELGMNQPGRTEEQGSVGVAVSDYDNDGDLDLFVASYGPDVLWQNQGDGAFVDVAPGTALAGDHHSVAAAWGDWDNDGWADLYVGAYLSGVAEVPDRLFRNVGGVFEDVTPEIVLEHGASHGVAWADLDLDGDLDLALANNHEPDGTHYLYRTELSAPRVAHSLQVAVLDGEGRWTRAGALVTVEAEGEDAAGRGGFVTSRLMDTGGGYASQGAVPVHFGIPAWVSTVSVRVVWFQGGERRTARVQGVDPARFAGQWLTLRLGLQ